MRLAERLDFWLPATVLRVICVLAGTTFAFHRLSERLVADGDPGFLSAVRSALPPERDVVMALGRTGLLAILALAVAAVVGLTISRLIGPRRRPGSRSAVGAELATAAVLAVAVPGLAWWPLSVLARNRGLIPSEPALVDQGGSDAARFLGFWAVLTALAIVPTVIAADRSRPDPARAGAEPGRGVGWLARAPMASRPDSPVGWRYGLPTMVLGLALASAETISGLQGLFGSFRMALYGRDAEAVMALAVPTAIIGAVVAGAVTIGLGRTGGSDRRWTGSDLAEPAPDRPDADEGGPRASGLFSGLVIVLALAVVLGAVVGTFVDPAAALHPALADPRIGGPWLGADLAGRDVARMTLAAMGPALVASLVPALGASIVGLGLQGPHRAGQRRLAAVVDALADLAWWSTPLVVALAAVATGAVDRPLLHPIVLLTTGLVLTPLVTRLHRPRPGSRQALVASATATTLLAAALALAVHVLVGFMTETPLPDWTDSPTLGQLTAEAAVVVDDPHWLPVLAPLAATTVMAFTLYLSAVLLAGQARRESSPTVLETDHVGVGAEHVGVGADHVEVGADPLPHGAVPVWAPVGRPLEPAPELAPVLDDPKGRPTDAPDGTRPLAEPRSRSVRAISPPGPQRSDPAPSTPVAAADPPPVPLPAPAAPLPPTPPSPPTEPSTPAAGPEATAHDIREAVTVASAVDFVPRPGAGDDPDEDSIIDEARTTIELRPSHFRKPDPGP